MSTFLSNAQVVLNHLECYAGKDASVYWLHHSCYRKLDQYYRDAQMEYSYSTAMEWLDQQNYCRMTMVCYKTAITRINDVYETGSIRFYHQYRRPLIGEFKETLAEYLSTLNGTFSSRHIRNIEVRCGYILRYLERERDVWQFQSITYQDIFAFCNEALPRLCEPSQVMFRVNVCQFLEWLADKGLCNRGYSLLLESGYLEKFRKIAAHTPSETCAANGLVPASEIYALKVSFCDELERLGYKSTVMHSANTVLSLFYLYLDVYDLRYSPEMTGRWVSMAEDVWGTCFLQNRRSAEMFDRFASTGSVSPYVLHPKVRKIDSLPEWCMSAVKGFLELKSREGKKESTVCMYRSSVVRLCLYLESRGVSSFAEISAELLKDFNLTDHHTTADGKNAYNVRIRKFLIYLYDHGLISNRFLSSALPCTSAPKTRIVSVLNPDETAALRTYTRPDDKPIGLRDRAIALLGLEMGLRSSDIVSLRYSQIDWHNGSIRFLQNKTEVERVLPMPTSVGNALYLYLTEGRPKINSEYIFISHKAPYQNVGRSVCGRILKHALPDRTDHPSGFHITRRTYATGRFINNCGFSGVADLLGHTTQDSVHRYISLDEEKMRLCPISIDTACIALNGGFRNE